MTAGHRTGATALSALGVCIATWLGSEFGNVVRFPDTGAAILFPPYAVLAAALMLTPRRQWWIYLLASFVGHMRGGLLLFTPDAAIAASTEVANATRALVGAEAWRRVRRGAPRFDTLDGTAIFLLIAGVVAPIAGATVGAAVVVLHGRAGVGANAYWRVWGAWFLSNAIIGVTLLPLLLVAAHKARRWPRRLPLARQAEIALLAVGLVIVSAIALVGGGRSAAGLPMRLYAPLPFLLWAATRFGPGATSASVLVVAGSAIVGVFNGWGPFASSPTDDGVLSLYLFLGAVSLPCLLLAALVKEREQVLAALSEGQQRYRLATDAGAVGVWDWTLQTGELYVDPNMKAAIGYGDDEIRNHIDDWTRHVHRDDVGHALSAVESYVAGRTPAIEVEYRMVHRDGSTRWFMTRGVAVRGTDNRPIRLIGTSTDVTERRCAQEAVREGEERMALAATSANLGFWSWNRETNAIWISEHGKRLCGLPLADQPTWDDLAACVHVQDRDDVREACAAVVEGRAPAKKEFRIVRHDGETRWVSVRGRFELQGSGSPIHMGVVVDVTERKLAELELHERRRELAHLSRVATLGQLSGALAHELRQPLTAILSNAQTAQRLLAKRRPDLEEVRAILNDIENDDARAGEMIRRLRALLKKGEASFEPLHLGTVVQDALDIAHADVIARSVVVVKEIERKLPRVYGDRVELQQVMVNLIMNACEAMADKPRSERRLTVGTSCDESGFVVAYVVDRGTGIQEQPLEDVFQPFVTSKRDGLGLGLAICRTIAATHHGRLWATNNDGGGATFTLALPPYTASMPTLPPVPSLPSLPSRPDAGTTKVQ